MDLNSATKICLFAYVSLPILGWFIVNGLKKKISPELLLETKERIRTWGLILALLTGAVLLGKTGLIWFFAMVSFFAFKEYISIIPTRPTDRRTLFWAYLAIPIQYILIAQGHFVLSLIFVPIYVFLFLPIRLILSGDTVHFLRSLSYFHWGLMMFIFCIGHAALFFTPTTKVFSVDQRISTILYLITLTQGNDIAQFIFGKVLGNKKIVPKISPGKTWAGFWGGVVFSTAFGGCIGPLMTPLSPFLAMVSGMLIGVFGFLGDVTFSAMKRDLKIKDTSMMLPGHGGIIDRIDSLTFTTPLFFHFFNYFWVMA
jgi:phosphatidate cytidylyltransferase